MYKIHKYSEKVIMLDHPVVAYYIHAHLSSKHFIYIIFFLNLSSWVSLVQLNVEETED